MECLLWSAMLDEKEYQRVREQQGCMHAGRPVDVQPLPDGSLLVSDDLAGAVYRITYNASSVPVGS